MELIEISSTNLIAYLQYKNIKPLEYIFILRDADKRKYQAVALFEKCEKINDAIREYKADLKLKELLNCFKIVKSDIFLAKMDFFSKEGI